MYVPLWPTRSEEMYVKTRAVVIHHFKYDDRKTIVELFTEESGMVSCLVALSRSRSTAVPRQLFMPLTVIEADIVGKEGAQLMRIREARQALPLTSIPFDPYKTPVALFLAEFLRYALRREQHDEPLFLYIYNGIAELDACRRGAANFHLVFLWQLARYLGVSPDMQSRGRLFDLRGGVFTDAVPPHGDYLDGTAAQAMRSLSRMTYANMHLFRMNRQQRNSVLDTIVAYYRLHLPALPELKSLDVLRTLFEP